MSYVQRTSCVNQYSCTRYTPRTHYALLLDYSQHFFKFILYMIYMNMNIESMQRWYRTEWLAHALKCNSHAALTNHSSDSSVP